MFASPGEPTREAHVIVRGRVQGVSFRWGVHQQALTHGVAGWVRNMGDGSVEALLQGPDEGVRHVIEWMRGGPRGAWVESLDATWSAVSEPHARFEIVG